MICIWLYMHIINWYKWHWPPNSDRLSSVESRFQLGSNTAPARSRCNCQVLPASDFRSRAASNRATQPNGGSETTNMYIIYTYNWGYSMYIWKSLTILLGCTPKSSQVRADLWFVAGMNADRQRFFVSVSLGWDPSANGHRKKT